MTGMIDRRKGLTWVVAPVLSAATFAVVARTAPAAAVDGPPLFIDAWGSEGSGDGQFNRPTGVAVDGAGNVYVADSQNYRIQEFTSNGHFIRQWGSQGSGEGQFGGANAVAVDDAGHVYVADYGNHRIQKFTTAGGFLAQWGSNGNGSGQFAGFSSVAVDADGDVYVADSSLDRVQAFTSNGVFLRTWGTHGEGDGQFDGTSGMAVDPDGNIYVTDFGNDRVQEFTSAGTFVTKWGTHGRGDGQFRAPTDIALGGDGSVYVVDSQNNRIQEFGHVPRPDGRIKKVDAGDFVGNNVYNTTGVDQTKRASAPPGSSVAYVVLAQNDAAFVDALRLRGTGSTASFEVTYTAPGGIDITAEVIAGTYTTPPLAPAVTFRVKVVVGVTSAAPAGSSLLGRLVVKSDSDPTHRDTVRFVTSRA